MRYAQSGMSGFQKDRTGYDFVIRVNYLHSVSKVFDAIGGNSIFAPLVRVLSLSYFFTKTNPV
jgi:hypothetical protein